MAAVKVVEMLNELTATCFEGQTRFDICAKQVRNPDLRALLNARANAYAQAKRELDQLRVEVGDVECTGSPLCAVSPRQPGDVRPLYALATDPVVLNACEREDAAVMMRYRDVLDCELPQRVKTVVQRQFCDLLQHHAELQGTRAATALRDKPVPPRPGAYGLGAYASTV